MENLGLIVIDSITSGSGLMNGGNMINKDSILISNIDQSALVNLDTLQNVLGATIICQTSSNGILNGQLNGADTSYLIKNSGDIFINESTNSGFLNSGKLENSSEGKINVERPHGLPFESTLGSIIYHNGILEIR